MVVTTNIMTYYRDATTKTTLDMFELRDYRGHLYYNIEHNKFTIEILEEVARGVTNTERITIDVSSKGSNEGKIKDISYSVIWNDTFIKIEMI